MEDLENHPCLKCRWNANLLHVFKTGCIHDPSYEYKNDFQKRLDQIEGPYEILFHKRYPGGSFIELVVPLGCKVDFSGYGVNIVYRHQPSASNNKRKKETLEKTQQTRKIVKMACLSCGVEEAQKLFCNDCHERVWVCEKCVEKNDNMVSLDGSRPFFVCDSCMIHRCRDCGLLDEEEDEGELARCQKCKKLTGYCHACCGEGQGLQIDDYFYCKPCFKKVCEKY